MFKHGSLHKCRLEERDINQQRRSWNGIGELHLSVESVLRHAMNNCLLCSVAQGWIADALSEAALERSEMRYDDDIEQFIRDLTRPGSRGIGFWAFELEAIRLSLDPEEQAILDLLLTFRYTVTLRPFRRGPIAIGFQFSMGDDTASAEGQIRPWLPIDDEALLSAKQVSCNFQPSLALVRHWLLQCQESHVACRDQQFAWRPTRLLYIDKDTIKLIICAETAPEGPYTTLSHCWGRKPFFTLTSDNLEAFKGGIPMSKFAQTFRDAMSLTKQLGVAYIWIDSYCILQGMNEPSRADWLKESKQMHLVYAHGIVNLGATCSESPDGGLYHPRQPQRFGFAVIDWRPHRTGAIEKHKIEYSYKDWPRGPLLSRGWVTQERILCRRMLHFTDTGIMWQCAQLPTASEEFPVDRPCMRAEYANQCSPGFLDQDINAGLLARADAYETWWQLIKSYSKTALSFPVQDKLLAIEGLGQTLDRKLNTSRVHGHPIPSLPRSLLWHSSRPSLTRVPARGLPSWSWASVDGPLDGFSPRKSWDAELVVMLEAYISDRICLIGRLLRARVYAAPVDLYDHWALQGEGWEAAAHFDLTAEGEQAREHGAALFLLPLFLSQKLDNRVTMLLLTRNGPSYRRVGVAGGPSWRLRRLQDRHAWFEAYRKTKPTLLTVS